MLLFSSGVYNDPFVLKIKTKNFDGVTNMTEITATDRPKQALVVPTPLYIRICISKSCSYKFKFSDKTADETQSGKTR